MSCQNSFGKGMQTDKLYVGAVKVQADSGKHLIFTRSFDFRAFEF